MNIGYRVFVVNEDNAIIQISQRSFNDFYTRHRPSLPRFSGCTITVAMVFYTLDNRKPRQIVRIDSIRIKVNGEGALDEEQYFENLRLVASRIGKIIAEEMPVKESGTVVDAVEKFDERRWSRLHPRLSGQRTSEYSKLFLGGNALSDGQVNRLVRP